jgi:hypothetical protein
LFYNFSLYLPHSFPFFAMSSEEVLENDRRAALAWGHQAFCTGPIRDRTHHLPTNQTMQSVGFSPVIAATGMLFYAYIYANLVK